MAAVAGPGAFMIAALGKKTHRKLPRPRCRRSNNEPVDQHWFSSQTLEGVAY
jgi:hypothetical protein